ncbi:hypothetical protein E2C01_082886 [Portunus trituberculatus]|uniref:Uncharacterized protein n=1 Tax=Portunus trituberculatus TaxID=210409 RepID=A0A5B7J315_PORTR|nr:hypothetical protein [Portunus trituberculatus]
MTAWCRLPCGTYCLTHLPPHHLTFLPSNRCLTTRTLSSGRNCSLTVLKP